MWSPFRLTKLWLSGAAGLLAATAPLAAQGADREPAPTNASGEAELAKIIAGRTIGAPQRCLHDSQRRSVEIIHRTALVFRDGDTIYVNRPGGARYLDQFDLPVFHIYGSNLCRQDRIELRERTSLIDGPILHLSDFIPYTLAKETQQ